MKITEFKKGDKIVRTGPSGGIGDRSYIGDKLTFVGIANGCAYFDREEDSFMSKVTGRTRIDLRLDWWSEGWEYWQDIDSIEDQSEQNYIKLFSLKIEEAIKNDDFELLIELQSIISEATKKIQM